MKIILKVLLNITSKVTSFTEPAGPYITDTVLYRQKLTELLNIYKPEVLVIENEEANSSYYTGTAQEYINLLNIAIAECKKRNIKVTNGGFTARMSKLLVWDYYISIGQNTKATECKVLKCQCLKSIIKTDGSDITSVS